MNEPTETRQARVTERELKTLPRQPVGYLAGRDRRNSGESKPRLAPGDRIADYRIVAAIGAGGMGHVYEAEHRRSGQRVAIKCLRRELAVDNKVVASFFQERRLVNRINHPSIVDVADFARLDDGTTFLVMELLEGESLRQRLRRQGRASPQSICALLLPICDALSAAHAAGVVHRDVKPGNIFLCRSTTALGEAPQRVVLLDFGVAKLVDVSSRDSLMATTRSGAVIGTPAYMSPEQARGVAVDARSDIFALGVIIEEMLRGARGLGAIPRSRPQGTATAPSWAPRLEESARLLEAIAQRSTARNPQDRYGSVDELARALSAVGELGAQRHNAAMVAWVDEPPGEMAAAAKRQLAPRIVHALRPAPHFRGRGAVMKRLRRWWESASATARVVSIVAADGAGKTAIVERFVRQRCRERARGGLYVWSFDQDRKTESFLADACQYFAGGDIPEHEAGQLQRLEEALGDGRRHLLVIDGLESVYGDGDYDRGAGGLRDHWLELLLRSIAAGLGDARALITSRYPLANLQDWRGQGHVPICLQDLDGRAVRAVLRDYGVTGEDRALDALGDQLGGHALSVAMLGSYTASYWAGDPHLVPLSAVEARGQSNPEARARGGLLACYAAALPALQRQVLAVLSSFEHGVEVALLRHLIAEHQLLDKSLDIESRAIAEALEQLRRCGLVCSLSGVTALQSATRKRRSSELYAAHPFVRDYFRSLVGVPEHQLHAAVSESIAPGPGPGPGKTPSSRPSSKRELDRCECYIEHLVASQRYDEAFQCFQEHLGGYEHLGEQLGELNRGARLLRLIGQRDGSTLHLEVELWNQTGLFALAMGDLALAERSLLGGRRLRAKEDLHIDDVMLTELLGLGKLALLRGNLEQALHVAEFVEAMANQRHLPAEAGAFIAAVYYALGHADEALAHVNGDIAKIPCARPEHLLALEHRALDAAAARRELAEMRRSAREIEAARCEIILGHLALSSSIDRAREHLAAARRWSPQSGSFEILLRAHRLASTIAYHRDDAVAAAREAERGMRLADSCGFGLLAIDLRGLLAKAWLACGEIEGARAMAEEALRRSEARGGSYAWGKADALHLLGVAHRDLGELQRARGYFLTAFWLQSRICHPEQEHTRQAVVELSRAMGDEWDDAGASLPPAPEPIAAGRLASFPEGDMG